MKRKKVLDSYALLAYLKKEEKYEMVKELLAARDLVLVMNEINVGECFYILARFRGVENAELFLERVLPNLPIVQKGNTFEDVIGAARIKANHSLSYADCFAVQTSLRENAPIVTGDPEFKKAENLVSIEWL